MQAPGGQSLPYEAARALFKRDPQRSWSGYVAGALVVLQQEKGACFEDGLSILVSSGDSRGVVRGKGCGLGSVRVDAYCRGIVIVAAVVAKNKVPELGRHVQHSAWESVQSAPHITVRSSHADVPEGKGVSSSAAVEVAAMSAVAAAYGIQLEGRELALLCQRVENGVVGELATCLSVAGVHEFLCALQLGS